MIPSFCVITENNVLCYIQSGTYADELEFGLLSCKNCTKILLIKIYMSMSSMFVKL